MLELSGGWTICQRWNCSFWHIYDFRRGFIMGIWNSHTSVGNILGSVIAGAFVNTNWGLSFIVPGAIIAAMGVIISLTLVPSMFVFIQFIFWDPRSHKRVGLLKGGFWECCAVHIVKPAYLRKFFTSLLANFFFHFFCLQTQILGIFYYVNVKEIHISSHFFFLNQAYWFKKSTNEIF